MKSYFYLRCLFGNQRSQNYFLFNLCLEKNNTTKISALDLIIAVNLDERHGCFVILKSHLLKHKLSSSCSYKRKPWKYFGYHLILKYEMWLREVNKICACARCLSFPFYCILIPGQKIGLGLV